MCRDELWQWVWAFTAGEAVRIVKGGHLSDLAQALRPVSHPGMIRTGSCTGRKKEGYHVLSF
jgi:hypothetical protein